MSEGKQVSKRPRFPAPAITKIRRTRLIIPGQLPGKVFCPRPRPNLTPGRLLKQVLNYPTKIAPILNCGGRYIFRCCNIYPDFCDDFHHQRVHNNDISQIILLDYDFSSRSVIRIKQ